MKNFLKSILVMTLVYGVGSLIYGVFRLGRKSGKVKVVNFQAIPKLKPGTLIIYNHPDLLDCMYEVILVPALFFPQAIWDPIKLTPWFTLDKRNFTDKWYFWLLKIRSIPVQRDRKNGGVKAAKEMLEVLENNGTIAHPMEPGRTCTGTEFVYSKSGKHKIRKPANSVGWLALKKNAEIVLVWTENGDPPIYIGKPLFQLPNFERGDVVVKISEPIKLNDELIKKTPEEVTNFIAQKLLELADQE